VSNAATSTSWKHYRVGLLVTGKGERQFLHHIFRSICDRVASTGRATCEFRVLEKIEQLTPRTSPKHRITLRGQTKKIPSRDEYFALRTRAFLQGGWDFVILIDDLEGERRNNAAAVYNRYRDAVDHVLPETMRCRASVHFLVNMLEAYYFANAKAINEVMRTDWADHDGDVETIGHPKNDLKRAFNSFDEIEHSQQIVQRLDLPYILSNPQTCASLRTLIGWCWRALGLPPSVDYQLERSRYFNVTQPQIDKLPPVSSTLSPPAPL
jgi:hypothetical protein